MPLYCLQHDSDSRCTIDQHLHHQTWPTFGPSGRILQWLLQVRWKKWTLYIDRALHVVCRHTPGEPLKCAYPKAMMAIRATNMMTQNESTVTIAVKILSIFVAISVFASPSLTYGPVVLASRKASDVGSAAIVMLEWCNFLNIYKLKEKKSRRK